MRRRLVLVTLVCASFIARFSIDASFAQTPDEPSSPPSVIESPAPLPPVDEPLQSGFTTSEQEDALLMLNDLRAGVRKSPDNADARLKLAQGLYRIGDLDAALDECRVALKLDSHNAKAHLQLGIILMAKQDGHAAAIVLMEAILLDPVLIQAHYSLGSVQYSLGNLPAAIQSYRRALDLQPNFPDACYRLALVLKLTNRHREAAQFMEKAAIAGVPQAQYFMGNAYRNGQGVEKNLALAIRWWTNAVEFGQQRAAESLSQLRRQALSPDQSDRRRRDAIEAFRQYRDELWADYPDASRNHSSESLGTALLKDSQDTNGVAVLLAEAYALSETAHDELAHLYETGLDTRLAQFDTRILRCFATTAADGYIPSKQALARIYGKGLGVTQDLQKAKAILKGLSKQEIHDIMAEFAE
jgi:TPR repeat protein